MSGGRHDLDRAQADCEKARTQLADTIGEITRRLSPRVLLGQAWGEIREKGGDVADEAAQVVRSQPLAVSGAAAAMTLFLARKPLGRMLSSLRGKERHDVIEADLDHHDRRIDLTAPVVPAPSEIPPPPTPARPPRRKAARKSKTIEE